ncbi:pollen-specific leucine-rich repeat extensin-like protein 4 [Iris pallida]|uniref:Pollen-specific leucine-rich repeat extensin-like protein 4 n=1 Tax=Iris pallida TaxID=29817 RepID=A0AAX6IKM7_IRIPA|nr:pollen-specific leucine-rich repeat extensin-like protein 4 [Iris pallida]
MVDRTGVRPVGYGDCSVGSRLVAIVAVWSLEKKEMDVDGFSMEYYTLTINGMLKIGRD